MLQTQILNYTLRRELAAGGMGTVYLAENQLGKQVAIKVLHEQYRKHDTIRKRFRQDAELMQQFETHPNIVTVINYDDQHDAIVMELIEGETLADRLQNHPEAFRQPSEAVGLFLTLLDTFAYIHAQGVVHRDIKPANLMLRHRDQSPVVLDFGIAKNTNLNVSLSQLNSRMGSLAYMSPEQIKSAKSVDARTDIYSLGATLFHLLTGRVPYGLADESELEIMQKITFEPFPNAQAVNPLVTPALQAVLDRATEKDVNRRFQSCAEFGAALKNVLVPTDEVTRVDAPRLNDLLVAFQQEAYPEVGRLLREWEGRIGPGEAELVRSVRELTRHAQGQLELSDDALFVHWTRLREHGHDQPRQRLLAQAGALRDAFRQGTLDVIGKESDALRKQKRRLGSKTYAAWLGAEQTEVLDQMQQFAEASRQGTLRHQKPSQFAQLLPEKYPLVEEWVRSRRKIEFSVKNAGIAVGALAALGWGIWQFGNRADGFEQGKRAYAAGTYAAAFPLLLPAAEDGNDEAQLYVGYLLSAGKGVGEDKARAREWFEKAAATGNAVAQYNLGVLAFSPANNQPDYAAAYDWFRRAAEQGHANAQVLVGTYFSQGLGRISTDSTQAEQWFRKAAGQNNPRGQYALGELLLAKKEYATALDWIRQAATQGLATAQNRLGVLYDEGTGVNANQEQATAWYQKAADQSHPDGIYNLGYQFYYGEGVERADQSRGRELMKKAAALGLAPAQEFLRKADQR